MSSTPAPLPASLLDLAETLGIGVALRLMQQYGGTEVTFPQRPNKDLVALLGQETAEAVCHFLSGAEIYVPHGRANRRRGDVQDLEAKGRSRAEIARALGISQRHVRRLANGPPGPMPLFPDAD